MGAILGGTSSAVVIPMVRQLALANVPATVLVLESAITDVLCIIVTAALLQAHLSGHASPLTIGWSVVSSMTFAALLGGLAALAFLFAVNLVRRMPNAMVAVIAFVFVTYGVAEYLGASGAIAALTLGFVLSNRTALKVTRLRLFSHVEDLREPRYVGWFLADAVFLLKTFFFPYLGISVRFTDWGLAATAVAAVFVVYAVRTGLVQLTMPPSTSRWDASVMSVMAPKGLAAAVLAGVPSQMGIAEGAVMQQFTYMVVLASIVFTSALVPTLSGGLVGRMMGHLFGTYAAQPPGVTSLILPDEDEPGYDRERLAGPTRG